MAPILLVKCKTKPFTSIGMILFGLGLVVGGGFFIQNTGSWWWLIAVAFGVFCLYHWLKILIQGSMTLVLYVDNEELYITYDHTKLVTSKQEEIKNLDHFSKQYSLAKIERFWREITKTNGSVSADVMYFQYSGEKKEIADLDYFGADIETADMHNIVRFLLSHNPSVQLGKA